MDYGRTSVRRIAQHEADMAVAQSVFGQIGADARDQGDRCIDGVQPLRHGQRLSGSVGLPIRRDDFAATVLSGLRDRRHAEQRGEPQRAPHGQVR